MKKRKSIFVKITLIMLIFVLATEVIALMFSFRVTYENILQSSEKQIKSAADVTVQFCQNYDLNIQSDEELIGETMSEFCETFGITYIFAVKPNLEQNSEKYLGIGFGEGASEKAKETRYPGVVVYGTLNVEQIDAYKGNTDCAVRHESNQFGDTLVCYMPCDRYYDIKTDQYKKYDEPYLIGAEITLTSVYKSVVNRFIKIAILTVGLTLLMMAIFTLVIYFRVAKPIRVICDRMSSFVTDREKGSEKLPVKGGDELALMAASFNTMTDDIDRYIGDIDTLTREKHTREAELNIARNIQMGLLPPDKKSADSFDISAYMLPAKDVGGDLYDYRILKDGRLYLAVADVSGKGVAASLFMSRAITLLNQYAQEGYSPAKTLEEYNNILAAQNPGCLFITTFVAIYDPKTGVLTYSNAGHNFPYVLSDKLIELNEAHGVAAGLFEGEKYEDACIRLKSGDRLFMFTDGVNEAKNAGGDFYSTERLEEKLTECIKENNSDILHSVLDDLNDFTKGAEQNDDITMLFVRIKPETVLHLKSEQNELVKIRETIDNLDASDTLKNTMYLAAEEVFVNICSYAYDSSGDAEIKIISGDRIMLGFTDSGKRFDPTADVLEIEDYDHDNAVGGLGRFLAFSLADDYSYEYKDGKNILKLYFKNE